jgi:hypothetical protein
MITAMMKLYSAVYVLSVLVEGALAGTKIDGLRYASGRVVVRIQDLLEADGLSVF